MALTLREEMMVIVEDSLKQKELENKRAPVPKEGNLHVLMLNCTEWESGL